jgi:hypothetical protein
MLMTLYGFDNNVASTEPLNGKDHSYIISLCFIHWSTLWGTFEMLNFSHNIYNLQVSLL